MFKDLSPRGVPDYEEFPIYRRLPGSVPYIGPDNVDGIKGEGLLDWMDAALCLQVDPELFFPEKGETGNSTAAKKVCFNCDVREECRDSSLERSLEYGVWAAETEKARRVIKKSRENSDETAA